MSSRPLLLDIFCGAGGCSVGYHRAGFDVVGIDHTPQKNYPFAFVQADAIATIRHLVNGGRIRVEPLDDAAPCYGLSDFDAIHASPPCQKYSRTRGIHLDRDYPDLIGETRLLLNESGLPWIMENVPESPMMGITLCGTQFGLLVIRHRKFESSVLLWEPSNPCNHPKDNRCATVGRPILPGQFVTVAGNISGVKLAGKAMGIEWMTRRELVQSIPPAYTEFLGRQLLAVVNRNRSETTA